MNTFLKTITTTLASAALASAAPTVLVACRSTAPALPAEPAAQEIDFSSVDMGTEAVPGDGFDLLFERDDPLYVPDDSLSGAGGAVCPPTDEVCARPVEAPALDDQWGPEVELKAPARSAPAPAKARTPPAPAKAVPTGSNGHSPGRLVPSALSVGTPAAVARPTPVAGTQGQAAPTQAHAPGRPAATAALGKPLHDTILEVDANVAAASVFIDGIRAAGVGELIDVEVGPIVIEVQAPGYRSFRSQVDLKPHERRRLSVVLLRE